MEHEFTIEELDLIEESLAALSFKRNQDRMSDNVKKAMDAHMTQGTEPNFETFVKAIQDNSVSGADTIKCQNIILLNAKLIEKRRKITSDSIGDLTSEYN